MFSPKPLAISKILSRPGKIHSSIIDPLKAQNRLLIDVKKAVPPFLREHCVACVVKENNLILFTDSPAWASRLRFHGASIIDELNQPLRSNTITKVKLRVLIPPTTPKTNREQHSQVPSSKTIHALKSSANTLSNIELKNALSRLALTLEMKKLNKSWSSQGDFKLLIRQISGSHIRYRNFLFVAKRNVFPGIPIFQKRL